MTGFLKKLRRDCAGSAIVEFALLAPTVIVMTLGVLQVGLWMQAYNALHAIASDTARYVTVQHQKGLVVANIDAAIWARNRAGSSRYGFQIANVTTAVVDSGTQTITGVTRKNLTVNYTVPSLLGMTGVGNVQLTFNRPIFVKSS